MNRLRTWLKRPLAEDFSWQHQAKLSVQAGVYIFLLLYLFAGNSTDHYSRPVLFSFFAVSCVVSSLLANALVPWLLPRLYDEDNWTVGRHVLHVLFVLFCVTLGNQLVLLGLGLTRPSFAAMYAIVTVVGFFPVSIGVFVAEQRRLRRNLAQARQLNVRFDQRHTTNVPDATPATLPTGIVLTGETGTDRLSLLPNQFVYAESVGNYVEINWLNGLSPQKTVLRSTLKDMEAALPDPPFFRCHRAFIVNLRAVNHTTGNSRGYQLTISGTSREIPVSRTYLAAFNTRLAAL